MLYFQSMPACNNHIIFCVITMIELSMIGSHGMDTAEDLNKPNSTLRAINRSVTVRWCQCISHI